MSSKWDDLAFLLHDVRWQEPEVVRLFQQTIQRSVPMACLPVPRCESYRTNDERRTYLRSLHCPLCAKQQLMFTFDAYLL